MIREISPPQWRQRNDECLADNAMHPGLDGLRHYAISEQNPCSTAAAKAIMIRHMGQRRLVAPSFAGKKGSVW